MLRAQGASVYVGDHVHDVEGALAAGITSVSVLTGGCTEDELRAAGTHVVLRDLTEFPAWLDGHLLETRLAALETELRRHRTLMVAFSGGADSAFLLAAAARTLGPDRVAAATAYSGSLPMSEREPALAFARDLGVTVFTPETDELAREGYRANAGDRCAFCKSELLDVLGPLAAEHGYDAVATGTNADDARAGFRPGIRAADERGAVTPLLDAGLTKDQVRAAVACLGPAHLGQAGRRLPELPDRLRGGDHAAPAGAGRARGGRRTGAAAARSATCGCVTSATAPGSRSTATSSAAWTRRPWPRCARPGSRTRRSTRWGSARAR